MKTRELDIDVPKTVAKPGYLNARKLTIPIQKSIKTTVKKNPHMYSPSSSITPISMNRPNLEHIMNEKDKIVTDIHKLPLP